MVNGTGPYEGRVKTYIKGILCKAVCGQCGLLWGLSEARVSYLCTAALSLPSRMAAYRVERGPVFQSH